MIEPWTLSGLRDIDRNHFKTVEELFPVSGGPFTASSEMSLRRPDIIRFQRRLVERYKKPRSARTLVLLPCSARKPYSFSKSHGLFREAISSSGCKDVHEVIVTSPIGLVPRELECYHPASNYDIAVTGYWTLEEQRMIDQLLKQYLKKNKYQNIIVHLPEEMNWLDVKGTWTCKDHPTSAPSLKSLSQELKAISEPKKTGNKLNKRVDEMASRFLFQFIFLRHVQF